MKHVILYAEDDRDMANLYIKDFQDNGYLVMWAKNGQEAIDMYRENLPNIVLLDVNMPRLNGFQVAKEIREKNPFIPVIFLTSILESGKAVKGLMIGADDYIRKDVEFSEVLARVRRMLQRTPAEQNPIVHITRNTWLDMVSHELNSCGKSCKLPSRDCNLLQILLLNKNNSQKRDEIISRVWGDNENGKDYMNKSMSSLRKLMSADKSIRIAISRGDSVAIIIND
ncbi:MAG: response regulator transcription factor [Prevotellaceae bacterium]|jgi:DNA-binding response OmpR family regulator|nr:response regulator transcription factor [Prevotellaceae bacterium]